MNRATLLIGGYWVLGKVLLLHSSNRASELFTWCHFLVSLMCWYLEGDYMKIVLRDRKNYM